MATLAFNFVRHLRWFHILRKFVKTIKFRDSFSLSSGEGIKSYGNRGTCLTQSLNFKRLEANL